LPRCARGFDTRAAYDALSRRDRKLGAWMRRIGPIAPQPGWSRRLDPVDALVRAVLFRPLSGKAAATIVGRVEAAIGGACLHADTLARIDGPGLRVCGVSGNKALALRDLARREAAGEIAGLRQMARMHQDAIIAALLPIRGNGRWTMQMLLLFRLARPDCCRWTTWACARAPSAWTRGNCRRRPRNCESVASVGARTAVRPAFTCGKSSTPPTPQRRPRHGRRSRRALVGCGAVLRGLGPTAATGGRRKRAVDCL